MAPIELNLYPPCRRSQNCSKEILSAPSTLLFNFEALFDTFDPASLTYFESCGILRKYVLRNSSQNKKLKGNLPIGQLVSHMMKKATKANCRKEFSCSCQELSWKTHGVDAIVISTNTHLIGSNCHWLFISGHEEIMSDYR